MTEDRQATIYLSLFIGLPILLFSIAFWLPVIRYGPDWRERQIAAENHLLESAPPVPGMVLVHDRDGRAKRVVVEQIESYQADHSGSVIWLKTRDWGILVSTQDRLYIQESVHVLDTLVRTARGHE